MSNSDFFLSVVSDSAGAYKDIEDAYDKGGKKKSDQERAASQKIGELLNAKKISVNYPCHNVHTLYFEAANSTCKDVVKEKLYLSPHNGGQIADHLPLLQNIQALDWTLAPNDKIDLSMLPTYSAFIRFPLKLIKPYLSRDDETFYSIENPVRKDKVFKVPMVSGSTWKGNLRWTATWQLVQEWEKRNNTEALAQGRFRLTLLFGDEKGEGELKNVADYLHKLNDKAADKYRKKIREHFGREGQPDLPHHAGCLRFFPTFFDLIGLEVINPHDRKTRAGTNPIYLESVPIGAKGVFSLLYVPLAYLGKPGDYMKQQVGNDLLIIYDAIKDTMLTYGFGAKKKAGFGEINEKESFNIGGYPQSTFQVSGIPCSPEPFGDFEGLKSKIEVAFPMASHKKAHDE